MKQVKSLSLPYPDGACNDAYALSLAARSTDRPLFSFSTAALRVENPARVRIGFLHQPSFIRTAMRILIFTGACWARIRGQQSSAA